jgi:hypothetical protein
LAGSAIVRGLVEKTEWTVVAAGRNAERLQALADRLAAPRLQTHILDATNSKSLAEACASTELVINCVGPYARSGAQIAEDVVGAGSSYMDIANEQVHYRRLAELDVRARDKGVILVTAVGGAPGISTLLALHAAAQIEAVDTVETFWAQARGPDPDTGLGSLMSGVLDTGFAPQTLRDGVEVAVRIGTDRKTEPMPEPFGPTEMLGVLTVDSLILPQRLPLRNIQSYWHMGEIPPGFFSLIRLLKPQRREWAYWVIRKVTDWVSRREYTHAINRGLDPGCVLKVAARNAEQVWEEVAWFSDGGVATSYLPVLTAKRFFEGQLKGLGLLTPVDLFEPEDVFEGLSEMGWPLRRDAEELK